MKKCNLLESTVIPLSYGISRGTETIMPKYRKKIKCRHKTTRSDFPGGFSPEQEMLVNTCTRSPSDF